MFQVRLKKISSCFKGVSRVFEINQESFNCFRKVSIVSRKIQSGFKEFQESFKKFQGYIKKNFNCVSKIIEGCFKGVLS